MRVAAYPTLRAAVTEATAAALRSLTQTDLRRARRWLDAPPEADDFGQVPSPHLLDLALHEPNLQQTVPFRRFLTTKAANRLSTDALLAARYLADAQFSIFRVGPRCGSRIELQDQLYGEIKTLIDNALSRAAKPGDLIGLRVFEVEGEWLVAGANAVRVSEDRLAMAQSSLDRTGRPAWGEPLAAQLLHDAMWGWPSA